MNRILVSCVVLGLGWAAPAGVAQTVQLPTVDTFNVQTTVIVPDGGSMFLGSVSRSAMSQALRGVPLLGNVPGAGRLFRNRGIGQEGSSRGAAVTAQVISLRELEEGLLAEGNRRLGSAPLGPDPQTQRRAEFLSRHMGQARGQARGGR
jgi:type II secretory pathway component GspD/PulD (secretin)